jgi:hypothetical protein
MTSIKPPSTGPAGPHTLPDTADVGAPQKAEDPASSSFQSTLEQAAQVGHANSPHQVGGTHPSGDVIAALVSDVEAGRVSLDQAVDRLLQQTLSKVDKHLSSDQVTELSGLLRDALVSDPTLRALRGERS